MSEREPITGELRDAMGTDHIFCDVGGLTIARNLTITQAEFERLCDAIDAVHAGLERENAELRQRVAELDKRGESMHDGGSITDELREWASVEVPYKYGHQLTAIADRIDAEHEAKVSYWQGASYKDGYDEGFASADDWLSQHEDAMAEHGWYRALCADRKPMLLGDRMEWANGTFTIHELRFTEGGCATWDSEHGYTVNADECHHHAPTVEDVLRKFAYGLGVSVADSYVAAAASKLRLAGDAS